jgi:hypothetical protein
MISKDEIEQEIRSTGADELVFVSSDPTKFPERCAQAAAIYAASKWPAENVRPKIKDLLEAAHKRNVAAALAADEERAKNPPKPFTPGRRGCATR